MRLVLQGGSFLREENMNDEESWSSWWRGDRLTADHWASQREPSLVAPNPPSMRIALWPRGARPVDSYPEGANYCDALAKMVKIYPPRQGAPDHHAYRVEVSSELFEFSTLTRSNADEDGAVYFDAIIGEPPPKDDPEELARTIHDWLEVVRTQAGFAKALSGLEHAATDLFAEMLGPHGYNGWKLMLKKGGPGPLKDHLAGGEVHREYHDEVARHGKRGAIKRVAKHLKTSADAVRSAIRRAEGAHGGRRKRGRK
jgi:hypothetical protein